MVAATDHVAEVDLVAAFFIFGLYINLYPYSP
jgi:hypothetical protein